MTKLSKKQARYQPPENGPFHCGGCEYFDKDGAPCEKVGEPIKQGGCCDFYEQADKSAAGAIAKNYKRSK